jgi:ZIP family zinc transporter
VDLARTLVLGAIAGTTIVIGMPLGRLRRPAMTLKLFLNAVAVGILLFLVWDVLSHAWEPIDSALGGLHDHSAGIGPVIGYGALFAGGLTLGLFSLVVYDSYLGRSKANGKGVAAWSPAKRLALLIAVGIGLHNFAEGLAIGQSAARNDVALATLLVVGFALHNATEGFGIVAPLAADVDETGAISRPSWAFLLTMAAIGGGPTFIGTVLGHSFASTAVSVVFLTTAAGSIIYVICQLIGVASRAARAVLLSSGLLIGLIAGFATDAIVTAAGA